MRIEFRTDQGKLVTEVAWYADAPVPNCGDTVHFTTDRQIGRFPKGTFAQGVVERREFDYSNMEVPVVRLYGSWLSKSNQKENKDATKS